MVSSLYAGFPYIFLLLIPFFSLYIPLWDLDDKMVVEIWFNTKEVIKRDIFNREIDIYLKIGRKM